MDESAGTATVVILVLGGASVFTNGIIETVQVELDTEEDTALGNCSYIHCIHTIVTTHHTF